MDLDKKALFHETVSFITAVHQVTFDITKHIPLGDITPAQYGILEYIAVAQPVTLSEISHCKHMSMPNTSRELKKLTDKGLCEKAGAEEDKRKQYIRLSASGAAFMDEAFTHMEAQFRELIGSASDEELGRITDAMRTLQELLFRESK